MDDKYDDAQDSDLFLERKDHISLTGYSENRPSYTIEQTGNEMIFLREVVHKMWKQDFNCSEFTLNYHTPEHFTRCFWQKSAQVKILWLAYRIFTALYFLVTWICSFLHVGRDVSDEDANKYFIFLTNWTYTLETLQFFLAMVIVIERAVKEKRSDFDPENIMVKTPWHYKFYWSLHTIVISASISVTCIFWAAVYDPQYNPLDFINFTTHVFNSIFMILDFILIGHPFRIAHIYLPNIYAILYLLFSLIYQLCGGTGTEGKIPIYGILDWQKPVPTIITCLIAQMFLMFVHILFWLFYKAKVVTKKNRSNSSGGKIQKEGIENYGMDMRIV